MLPPGTWRVNPGAVEVRLDAPIDVGPYRPSDANGLLALVRATIERRLEPAAPSR
jgi:hypothetical protein